MKILKLVLKLYRGFRLRQIDYFEYRPTKKTQVVLGTNGSGKSQLLKELSPLPAHPSDFAKGGSKEITIEHNGRQYLLQSLFTPEGPKYHFIADGEELNPGHTVTVYRELVKQHFNYIPELHLLLTGKTKFSSMSVADRRNWFTRISDVDYTYAIKYHQRLKEKIRDIQGAIKLAQARLVHEKEKCLNREQELQLREKVSQLSQILNTLLDHRKPRLNQEYYLHRVASVETSLEDDLARLEKLLARVEGQSGLKTIEELQRDCMRFQAELGVLLNEITKRSERVENLQKELQVINQTSSHSLEEVQKTIKDLEAEETETLSMVRLGLHFDEAMAAQSAFESIRPSLEDIFVALSECPRTNYRRTEYQSHLEALPVLEQNKLKAKQFEEKWFTERQTLELHRSKGEVDCPSCHHRWTPNYDEWKYKKVIAEHELAISKSQQAVTALEKHCKLLQEHEHYFTLMERYLQITRHFPVLNSYWSWLNAERLMTSLDVVQMSTQTLSNDLRYLTKAESLRTQLKEHRRMETLMLNTRQVDKSKLEKEMEEENQALVLAQAKSRTFYQQNESTKATIALLRDIDECAKVTQDLLSQRDESLKLLMEDSCVAALDEIIRSVKLALSQHERTLSQIDIQQGVVANLSSQIAELSSELKVLKLAQKALSPSEGLIAKGMTGFINHFVKQTNAFIERIWLYPLELMPIEITDEDSVDLDYRFSVKVNDDLPVPDISLCSAGMREVIDLAFIAVSMRYLGLTNFPIFLDEFAVALDPAHRQQAYQAIDHLIDSTDYSQVFLVSHYQDGYSSLMGSEVLVLCDSNVQLPSHLVYNQHAVLN